MQDFITLLIKLTNVWYMSKTMSLCDNLTDASPESSVPLSTVYSNLFVISACYTYFSKKNYNNTAYLLKIMGTLWNIFTMKFLTFVKMNFISVILWFSVYYELYVSMEHLSCIVKAMTLNVHKISIMDFMPQHLIFM